MVKIPHDPMVFDPEQENPYIKFKQQWDHIEKIVKETDAQVFAFQDEFRKVFHPDQTRFDALKDEAKDALVRKKPTQVLDDIYYKMAMIYKRWSPCKEYLHRMNPSYANLFMGLENLLKEIDLKEKNAAKNKKDENNAHKKRPKGNGTRISKRKKVS